jgi:beta-mannosidase
MRLRQVWQPLQVILTDEGLNGLHVHDQRTATPRTVRLTLRCLRDGEAVAAQAEQTLTLAPRETRGWPRRRCSTISSISPTPTASARPRTTWSWPRCTTTGCQSATRFAAQPVRVPAGPPRRALRDPGLQRQRGVRRRRLVADRQRARFARWVHIDDHAYLPETDWFHLGPANRGASA